MLLPENSDALYGKATFFPLTENGQFGFILRSSRDHDRCYQITFDRGNETVSFERFVTTDSFVGPLTEGHRLLSERHLPLKGCESFEAIVLMDNNIVELFVCGVTMTVPIADIQTGRFGLFACDAKVRVTNIVLSPAE